MAKERGVHNDCATIGDMVDDAGELGKKGLRQKVTKAKVAAGWLPSNLSARGPSALFRSYYGGQRAICNGT